mmetsp:Transcript_88187/g.175118  ORF Transcript_88187/g.175118 Transcript_88187/m.175118 type:complete len:328 (+) Transcript_88187:594-1577(+)
MSGGSVVCKQSPSRPLLQKTVRNCFPSPQTFVQGPQGPVSQTQPDTLIQDCVSFGAFPGPPGAWQSENSPLAQCTYRFRRPVPHCAMQWLQAPTCQRQPSKARQDRSVGGISALFRQSFRMPLPQVTFRRCVPAPHVLEHGDQSVNFHQQPEGSWHVRFTRGAPPWWSHSLCSPLAQDMFRDCVPMPQLFEHGVQSKGRQRQPRVLWQGWLISGRIPSIRQFSSGPFAHVTLRRMTPWPQMLSHSPHSCVSQRQEVARMQVVWSGGLSVSPSHSAPLAHEILRVVWPMPQPLSQFAQLPTCHIQPRFSTQGFVSGGGAPSLSEQFCS